MSVTPSSLTCLQIVGSFGYILIGALLVFIVVMDITTIGKHLAMMRDNLCSRPADVEAVVTATSKWKQKLAAKNATKAAAGADKPKTTIAVAAKGAEAEPKREGDTPAKQSMSVYHGSQGNVQDV